MILDIDCGNTRLKWRLLNACDESIIKIGSILVVECKADVFFESSVFSGVSSVRISTVSNASVVTQIRNLYELSLGVGKVFVASPKKELCGVRFAYQEVDRLGVDRCLAMVAAYHRCPEGVLVADCGSAMTVDLVDSKGDHLGGYILPGSSLLSSAVLGGTDKVLVNEKVVESCMLGDTTESCVLNGANMMALSMLQTCSALALREGVTSCLITGGDSQKLLDLGLSSYEYVEGLVFEGLSLVGSRC